MLLIDRVLSVLASPTPGIPLLIGGCGAGRTHVLRTVLARLDSETTPVYLDIERLATTPEQCYRSLLRHVRVAEDAPALPAPASLSSPRDAFHAVLALLTKARAASGRRFTFLLDEVLDLRTFESFPGLRQVQRDFIAHLAASPAGFVLASRFTARTHRLLRDAPARFEVVHVPPLDASEVQALAMMSDGRRSWAADMAAGAAALAAGRAGTVALLLQGMRDLGAVTDPVAALVEARRALTPDAVLLFAEHGRSPDPAVRRWQQRVTPVWRRVAGGCRLDRDPLAILASAGFRVRELDTGYLAGWKPAAWHYLGTAVPA